MVNYVPLDETNIASVRALCNRNLEFDKVSLDLFRYKTLGDPDFDPAMAIVALNDGSPCGFMMGVVRQSPQGITAGLKLLAVDREFGGRGIASDMLRFIENRMRDAGAETVTVGYVRPNYLTPGIDPRYTSAVAFLLRRGYEMQGENFNMDVDLSVSDWSTEPLESELSGDGIACRRLRPDEAEALGDWIISQRFSPGWRYQVTHAAEQNPVAVFVAERASEYLGFASYHSVRPGWFGPMGTSTSWRGRGIGTVTFLKCLQAMKAEGWGLCEIGAVGPLYFYSKTTNATVSRIFWQLEKTLVD